MTDALRASLDRLFQLPPGQLVAERDALAAQLRKAGDKQASAQVKVLKRPTPAAWALNQLYFQQPTLLQAARASAEHTRALHAQDQVPAAQLTSALQMQHACVQKVVEAGLQLCQQAGLPYGAEQRKKLLSTLQAVLAGTAEEVLGRMTRDVEATGFDAISVVGSVAPRATRPAPEAAAASGLQPAPGKSASAAPAPSLQPGARAEQAKRALAQARARLARYEVRVSQAQRRVEEQQRHKQHAERAVTDLQRRASELERELSALRTELQREQGELARNSASLAEAQTEEAESQRALRAAREQLQQLRGQEG